MGVREARPGGIGRIARDAGILAGGILGSRILGLVRDVLRAALLGTGTANDAWVIAYRLPNLLRAFFAEGSLTAAFVPVISRTLETESRERVWQLVSTVLSVLGIVLAIVTAGAIAFAPAIVPWLAPGFQSEPSKLALTVWLTQATFPYLLLIAMATVLMGTLNAFRHFRAPALAPGVMNVCLILALVFVCPRLGEAPTEQVRGLAIGVIAGGLAQILVQLPPLWRRGFRPRFRPAFSDPGVRRIGALMLPGVVGIGISEINAVVDTVLGSLLEPGSVSGLEYGMRLMHLPLGVVGVAMGTATLPALSRHAVAGELDELRATFRFALRTVTFLMLPAAIVLLVLAVPIVRLIFERGAFDGATSTAMTASAVMFYGSGLLFYGAVKVTVPVFYAFHDTKTPVKCAAVAMVSNIGLNLALMGPLRLGGLALATALSAGINIGLLLWFLRRRIGPFFVDAFRPRLLALTASAAVMAAVMVLGGAGMARMVGDGFWARAASALVPLAAGGAAYLGTAHAMGAPEATGIVGTLLRRVRR